VTATTELSAPASPTRTAKAATPKPRRSRLRPPFRLRLLVQLVTLLLVVVIGLQFAHWVGGLESGDLAGSRPPGAEGFLPIAGLIALKHWLVSGQFSMAHPAALVLVLLALATALLLRKAFCAWLCPIGTGSEWLARLSQRAFGRVVRLPRWLDLPLRSIKYLLLAFFLHAIVVQMSAPILEQFLASPYHRVADIKMLYFFTRMSSLTMQVLIGLVALSFVVPFFWCRYLCPYGALLGAFAWLSPLQVRRSVADCTRCGHCATVCPSFLPVDRLTTVRSPECTSCLQCVVHCPQPNALALRTPGPWRRAVRPAAFAALVVALFFGGIGVAKATGRWHSELGDEELRDRVQRGLDGPEYGHFGR
jgi:polyferredoxin